MTDNVFKIITPAYNCSLKIEKTIRSVACQDYDDWHMTIIDDVSSDDTFDKINFLIKKYEISKKVTVKKRTRKYGEVENTISEVSTMKDTDIVVRLDAGDWLTDLGCFHYLNLIYKKYDPAVVWTAHRWSYTDQNISGEIDYNISIYKQPWRSSHLKTFRVRDFLGLNKKNFLDEDGNYIMIACDQAIFLPMMERARINNRPLIFFPRVMYHYDIDLNDTSLFTKPRSINQKMSAEKIRERGLIL